MAECLKYEEMEHETMCAIKAMLDDDLLMTKISNTLMLMNKDFRCKRAH